MRKFLRVIACLTIIVGSLGGMAFGWYTISNVIHKDYTLSVESSSGGLNFTQTSCNNNSLTPITGSVYSFLDENGNSTTDYYEVTYSVTASSKKKMYVKSITWPTAALGSASRILVSFNGSSRLYAPSGATTGYTVGSDPVAFDTVGGLMGILNGSGTITVRIFLEGQDAACTNANAVSSLNFGIDFEGVDI